MKQVVLIGDSIRMGYQAAVRRELAAVAEVWGPEENGGTSANVLAHLDEWALARSPALVHVNCGLHDLRKAFGEAQSFIPLTQYAANVREVLTRLTAMAGTRVVWASTTPVDEKRHHAVKGFDRFEADVRAYNAAALAVAAELGVAVDDLFAVVTPAGKGRLLGEDGVHFTAEGYDVLGQAVAGCIRMHIRNQ